MITTQIIRDEAQFGGMRGQWNALLEDSPSDCLFLSWEWLHTWWTHLSRDRTLHIVTVHDNEQLIAIAPLALRPPRLRRLIPFQVLEFLASDNVGSDYLSFIVRNGHENAALEGISSVLNSTNYLLELVRIDKTSLPMMSAAVHLQAMGWQIRGTITNHCPYIDLSGLTTKTFFKRLHAHHRSDLEQKFRKVQREFDVRLQLVRTDEERHLAMSSFVDLHLTRWSEHGGSTALGNQRLIEFHEALSKIALDRGWLRMYTLMLDDAPAAQLYMFDYHGVYYYYQTAISADYYRYSVGTLITRLAIDDAIENAAVEFDFLHDDEEYKYLWADRERELIRLELFPPPSAQKMYGPVMRARETVKRLKSYIAAGNES